MILFDLTAVKIKFHPLADGGRNLSPARNLTPEEMAVAADARQGRTRRHNRGLWLLCAAIALLVTTRHGRIANVTKITNGGYAGVQLPSQTLSDDRVQCFAIKLWDAIQRACLAVCDKMNVGVNEPGKHRRARVVVHRP